ncbi:septation protein SepH [Actinopolymorpha pittospori]|uniref:DUF3071 domain-containing protein n=1 Tax=Actinopolymorpha pittospori TaxID=648752 RepID=A0A927N0S1_9ACTN|nr:septation protein SepH [Actinopolymorpha pittospori]MBE1610505.1 hypothetical protein [Actinopolymorpha pittospori]
MRDVKLVSLSDDGTHLVLTHEGTGEEFALRVDDRLRGAVVSDRARLGLAPLEKQSLLRPKEIQARLRAGESSESVALAAEVPIEKILRYAGPVLAEREYIADQARRCALRRNGREGPAQILDEAVTSRLDDLGVGGDNATWDAWRTPEGRWSVAATFTFEDEEHRASFHYDPLGRVVTSADDTARALVGEVVTSATANLQPAPKAVAESEDDRGENQPRPLRDAHRLRLAPPPLDTAPDTEDTIDLSHSVGQVAQQYAQVAQAGGQRPRPMRPPGPEVPGPADLAPDEVPDLDEAPADEPAAPPTPAASAATASPTAGTAPADAPSATTREAATPAPASAAATAPAAAEVEETPEQDAEEESYASERVEPKQAPRRPRPPADARRKRARSGKGRGNVPSWDDILFGGSRGGQD